jgi:acyl carrier protein
MRGTMNANLALSIEEKIRGILKEYASLERDAYALRMDDDLYEAGMTSHASVNVMLALESEFDVEFPDQMLTRSMFESIESMQSAVEGLIAA